MHQIHAEGALRHAEKRRRGTCEFANRIARISLKTYEKRIPTEYRELHRQTCVASIVACISLSELAEFEGTDENKSSGDRSDQSSHLQVMGLGVGTKYLSTETIRQEQLSSSYGYLVRDCHAEVLARRSFKRQLLEEISSDIHGKNIASRDYIPILERVLVDDEAMTNDNQLKRSNPFILDHQRSCIRPSRIKYQLKPGVTLHFYASSAPCGNATLKKFVKMEKEVFDTSLGSNEWPRYSHSPIASHSVRLGQFALLVKKDVSSEQVDEINRVDSTSVDGCGALNLHSSFPWKTSDKSNAAANSSQQEKLPKHKCIYREDDSWCPPSCSITNFDKGTIHSCSDKICRWNCLGLQGSLLMVVLDEPLYISTLTVGRKFSRATCQRAVCCRANGFGSRTKNGSRQDPHNGVYKYRLNHPTLMETNVYMDENGTHDMGGTRAAGRDASFHSSNSCWAWWPGKDFSGNAAECIDGKTGLVSSEDRDAEPRASDVSTASMLLLISEIFRASGLSVNPEEGLCITLSLDELRLMKRQLSPEYEAAKDELLCHRVFREWSCRCCR